MLISKYLDQIKPYLQEGGVYFRGVSDTRYMNETGVLRKMLSAMPSRSSLSDLDEKTKRKNKIYEDAGTNFDLQKSSKDPNVGLDEDYRSEHIAFNKSLIAQARKQGYGEKNLKELSDLEILSELQHFGAATCLLDFSESFPVALWFAVNSSPEKDGKITYLNEKNVEVIHFDEEKKSIRDFLESGKLYSWSPQVMNSRISAQHSVFILGPPILNEAATLQFLIDKKDKAVLLYELDRFFNINQQSLFPDFQGFALSNAQGQGQGFADHYRSTAPIFDYLIRKEKWADLQEDIMSLDSTQVEKILRALFQKNIEISEQSFHHARKMLSKSDLSVDLVLIIGLALFDDEKKFPDHILDVFLNSFNILRHYYKLPGHLLKIDGEANTINPIPKILCKIIVLYHENDPDFEDFRSFIETNVNINSVLKSKILEYYDRLLRVDSDPR